MEHGEKKVCWHSILYAVVANFVNCINKILVKNINFSIKDRSYFALREN